MYCKQTRLFSSCKDCNIKTQSSQWACYSIAKGIDTALGHSLMLINSYILALSCDAVIFTWCETNVRTCPVIKPYGDVGYTPVLLVRNQRIIFLIQGHNPPQSILTVNVCIMLHNMQVTSMESPYQVKEEEENAMHNTVVIFSSNDSFTLKQVGMCIRTQFIHSLYL